MDRGAWQATVHGVAKSRTGLSDFAFTFHFHALEKEMATHSSVLAWDGGAWWAAIYGVAQSQTRLKGRNSSIWECYRFHMLIFKVIIMLNFLSGFQLFSIVYFCFVCFSH